MDVKSKRPPEDQKERLNRLFALQKQAFAADMNPSLEEREERLRAGIAMVGAYREKIHQALVADFTCHSRAMSDFIEVFGTINKFNQALSELTSWTEPSIRPLDEKVYGQSKGYVVHQAKGVIGNMLPWNFPFDIGLGPLSQMLAGGNRVIIKPSDLTPECGALLEEMTAAYYEEDLVAVVNGDIELAKAFPSLQWDHLMYTGNPDVGRLVAVEASKNLTPLTLELGGKNPAIVAPDAVTRKVAGDILRIKMIKSGQMCVSPDYVLVPEDRMSDFVANAQNWMDEEAPDFINSDNHVGIMNDRHVARLNSYLDDARSAGADVIELTGENTHQDRRMGIFMIIDPPADTLAMKEEVFGPILNIVPYRNMDNAIAHVKAAERPLGVYLYTDDEALKQRVMAETHSGGVTINACALHSAMTNIGFGGSGMSGYGRHHGIEGFLEFTNPRAIVEFDQQSIGMVIAPPYEAQAAAVIKEIESASEVFTLGI